jgi:hypothetical protein
MNNLKYIAILLAALLVAPAISTATYAASTTFYFNNFDAAHTFSNLSGRVYTTRAGRLEHVTIHTMGYSTMATAGSLCTIAVEKNDSGTWTTITSTADLFTATSKGLSVDCTSLGLTHAAGDFYNVRLVTPAWATAPAASNIEFWFDFS